MMLDVTSGTNAFDVALVLYQWKYEFAPFFAELSTLNTDVPGAPPLAQAAGGLRSGTPDFSG